MKTRGPYGSTKVPGPQAWMAILFLPGLLVLALVMLVLDRHTSRTGRMAILCVYVGVYVLIGIALRVAYHRKGRGMR